MLDNQPMVGGEAKRNELDVDGVRLIRVPGLSELGGRHGGGEARGRTASRLAAAVSRESRRGDRTRKMMKCLIPNRGLP